MGTCGCEIGVSFFTRLYTFAYMHVYIVDGSSDEITGRGSCISRKTGTNTSMPLFQLQGLQQNAS